MYEWKKVILNSSDTMSKAIQVLNEQALRIIMVADHTNKLIGTITDGDIRRSLLLNMGLDTKLMNIMHKNPKTVFENDSDEKVLSIMRAEDILQIPIIDQQGIIIGLKNIQNSIGVKRLDNIVFLMAGGFGKRLKPLTDSTPKPLLLIGGKPILEIIIKQCIEQGFHNFVISTHYKAEMFKQYFGDGDKWGVSINYVHEEAPMGTAGSLGLMKKTIIKEPILVLNGDLLTKVDFENLLNFHDVNSFSATLCVHEHKDQIDYGVVTSLNNKLVNIEEKPINKFFINAGIYIINPSLINDIEDGVYLDMPDFLKRQTASNIEVGVFPMHEYWLDVGQIKQLKKAQKDSNLFT